MQSRNARNIVAFFYYLHTSNNTNRINCLSSNLPHWWNIYIIFATTHDRWCGVL